MHCFRGKCWIFMSRSKEKWCFLCFTMSFHVNLSILLTFNIYVSILKVMWWIKSMSSFSRICQFEVPWVKQKFIFLNDVCVFFSNPSYAQCPKAQTHGLILSKFVMRCFGNISRRYNDNLNFGVAVVRKKFKISPNDFYLIFLYFSF